MKNLSLLPPRIKEKRLTERRQAVLVRVMIAFFIVVLVVYAFLLVSAMLTQSNIKSLRFEREALELQIGTLKPYAELFEQMNSAERKLNQAMGTVTEWNELLLDLGNSFAAGTWFSDLALTHAEEGGRFFLNGWAYSQDNISQLIKGLQGMEQLTDVRLQGSSETEQAGQKVLDFSVEAVLNPGEPYLEDVDYTPGPAEEVPVGTVEVTQGLA